MQRRLRETCAGAAEIMAEIDHPIKRADACPGSYKTDVRIRGTTSELRAAMINRFP